MREMIMTWIDNDDDDEILLESLAGSADRYSEDQRLVRQDGRLIGHEEVVFVAGSLS
jgi:hypothetical protein